MGFYRTVRSRGGNGYSIDPRLLYAIARSAATGQSYLFSVTTEHMEQYTDKTEHKTENDE